MERKKILFVCPYPFDEAPSQRFRYEQYLSALETEGFQFELAPFLNLRAWKMLYKSGQSFQKLFWLVLSFIKRFFLLFQLYHFEYIFIHREATPVGPPFFEWAVRFIWKKKIIYDFDDAIWLEDPNEKGSLKARIKWKSKVKSICKWSYKVSSGNDYLAQFAKKFNERVVVNPTTINTDYHKEIKVSKREKNVIGWTGTHSTLPYLKIILPVLDELAKEYDFELLVISNQKPDFDVRYMRYIPWRKSKEIQDLNQMDIGIMPLTNDIWSQGKCGFKLLQYMAIQKAVIASPVGVNKKMIQESGAGYLAETKERWQSAIAKLLMDPSFREDLGKQGQEYVENNYSVNSNKSTFLSLFQ
ncbi:glycosyl transferase [Marivirga tractuosa]|uniref:Glycosyl transferase group 1 n=1 Tax=Marivirga tractuosa (strain ATCC 23168 / DSM 4126 / NBRC 15989 / NCIMB 1408 / VKM B-1430 / H-43) TaxID=643867 RepID=E4TQI3_MARTH|nr:glycosyltransferase [Marivirga tractuosa]ADR23676.1 glycosyl transferase group 1 [Marivirga tractuosa DSM 4126]BDD15643.1 glycosyl transferase [Marivirga tractuosa]